MKTKISGKRPIMFYQPGKKGQGFDLISGARLRIVYPDGTIEWGSLASPGGSGGNLLTCYWFKDNPCYLQNKVYATDGSSSWVDFKPDNMKHALRVIREFDKAEGFPRMQFLGEL